MLGCAVGIVSCDARARGTSDQGIIELRSISWAATPTEQEIVLKLVEEFNRQNPDILVRHEILPQQGYASVLLTSFAAGNAPDVFWVASSEARSYAARSVLLDLTPFIEKDGVDLNDFFPATLEPYGVDGRYYGLPNDACSCVMFYNKELFRKAGVPFPKEGWTWEEFLDACRSLTKDLDGDGQINQWAIAIPGDILMILPFVYSNGGNVFDPSDPDVPLFDRPEAIEALDRVFQLALSGEVAPLRGQGGDQTERRGFQIGRMAMMISGWWDMTETDIYAPDLDYAVAPLPMMRSKATQAFSTATVAYAQTPNPEAAWRFIDFMTGYEGQVARSETGMAGPSRRSVGKHPYFAGRHNDQVFLDTMEDARAVYGEHFTILMDELIQAQERVLQETQTTKQAFEQAKAGFLRRIAY